MSAVPAALGRGDQPGTVGTAATLLALLSLPAVLFAVGAADSLSAGTALFSTLLLTRRAILRGRGTQLATALAWLPVALTLILLHLALAATLSPINWTRGLGSIPLVVLLLMGGGALADLLETLSARQLAAVGRLLMAALLVIGLFGALGWLAIYPPRFEKVVFPFTEPSHFAMALAAFLIFACASNSPLARVAFLALSLLIIASLQNLTGIIVCLLAAMIAIPSWLLAMLALVEGMILSVAPALELDYYIERLDFSDQSQNLSSLVYLQGWELIEEAWNRTSGIGLGFQQLGVSGTEVASAELIQAINGEPLNLLDGGFALAKWVGEFGGLGVVIAALLLALCVKAAIDLKRAPHASRERSDLHRIFGASLVAAYLIELLVRSGGYFNPSSVLLVTGLLMWLRPSHWHQVQAALPTGGGRIIVGADRRCRARPTRILGVIEHLAPQDPMAPDTDRQADSCSPASLPARDSGAAQPAMATVHGAQCLSSVRKLIP